MKKLLVIILIGLVIATAASYIGMQWKVRKTLDDFFQNMPLVEGTYDDFSFDFNGRMTVHDIIVEIPLAGVTIDVNSISFATSNFWETLSIEKSLQEGRLPKSMQVDIDTFSIDLQREALAAFSQQGSSQNLLAELSTLGCGRHIALSPVNYYDMGINNLTMDLSVGYDYNDSSDELISSVDLYMDGMGRMEMDQTIIGLYPVMENYRNALFGLDPSTISTTNISMAYTDLGYNSKYQSFCSVESGMEKSEWLEHHLKMINAVIGDIDLSTDFDLLGAYRQLLADRSYIEVDLRPLSGFSMSDLQFYGASELIDLVDLKISINDEPLAIGKFEWDNDKLAELDLSNIRREFRIANAEEEAEQAAAAARSAPTRMLIEVPLSSLANHQYRTVQIQRKDGYTFTGEMISVNSARVIVRTRFSTGFTDLPLERSEIAVVKLYPE
ncbi:hypothetical protein [Reinekea marinisedimentorum]|uniref:Uncharacterized protein n=1 Tax=Reinekea marinisedimentorum TaxID=230495 RepID=A0A4R3I7E3_9GAMM|nr:hypothetical protein [Reinekea marinisedimentorum]TCS42066.1 hypothetical protein BCF53_104171 [Reinekea marinisedimentorum]